MTAPMQSVLGHIRNFAAPMDGASDPALLERFLRHRDEAAFAALVERHGPMVLNVGRRVLSDGHAAEDVFQAAFLVLARQASAIRKRASIGSWLHGVALRLARKAKAQSARANRPDERPAPTPADPLDDLTWREMRQVLDDELRRLPERYRLPLVLCYLEGRTRDEAAAQLGCSAQRLKGQLERGRDRLRRRLMRRGIAPAAAVSAALMTEPASAAVPPLLAVAVVPAALAYGHGQTVCGASTLVVALANGAIPTMTSHIWKIAAALLVVTGLAVAGARAVPGGDKPAPDARRAKAEPAPVQNAVAPLQATFLGKQDGKPPMRVFHVKLDLSNPSDKPVWLVLGYYGDARLQGDGKFTSDATDGRPQCFAGKYFDGEKNGGRGKVIEIDYIGRNGFRAFHLPPRAAVTLDDFSIGTWSDITRINVMEASELRVNGKTPFQDWLPYPTLSDEQARIRANTNWDNLDWDSKTLKSRVDYPNEKVASVEATVLRSFTVSIPGSEVLKKSIPSIPTAIEAHWNGGGSTRIRYGGFDKIVFSTDGETLLGASRYPGKVQWFNIAHGPELNLTPQDDKTRYELLGFDRAGEPLGYQILIRPPTANTDSALVLVNLRTGERRNTVEFSEPDPRVRRYRHVALSPDEATLAVSEWPDKILLFDVKTAKRMAMLTGGDDRPVQTMLFAPDGRTLAVTYSANEPTPGRKRNEIAVWDLQRRERLWSAYTPALVRHLAFSSDGKRLASSALSGDELPLWDAKTGKIVQRFRSPTGKSPTGMVALSLDGRWLAASFETGVAVWDVGADQEPVVLYATIGHIRALTFSPDGTQIALVDDSSTLFMPNKR